MASYKATNDQKGNFMKQALKRVYGNRCMYCGLSWESFSKQYPNVKDFLLEHVNGNPTDYDFDNCKLACYSCNQRKRPDFQDPLRTTGNPERVSDNKTESENAIENYQKQELKRKAAYEIQLCETYEPMIRRYVWEQASREGGLRVSDAIKEAAEYSGADIQTVERKLEKAFSRIGPFDAERSPDGKLLKDAIVVIRQNYKPNVNTAMGRLDYQVMQEQRERAEMAIAIKQKELEEAASKARELEQESSKMQESFSKLGRERDQYKRLLEQITGKPIDEITAEIQQTVPPTENKQV